MKKFLSISCGMMLFFLLAGICFYSGFETHKRLRLIAANIQQEQSYLTNPPVGGVQSLIQATMPSIVSVRSAIRTDEGENLTTGSGSIISGDGLILTNYHVAISGLVHGSKGITLIFYDRTTAPAHVIGFDEQTDLAVLKTNRPNLHPIRTGVSKTLQVGQEVVAIGAPQFLDFSVSAGIISSLDRSSAVPQEDKSVSYYSAIQTDAAVNPGNSGGALIDTNGYLIGVNSAGYAAADSLTAGLNYAIPIDDALRITKQIITHGRANHGTMGMMPIPDKLPPGGAPVIIIPHGPAALAGIPNNAYITEFDGRRVVNALSLLSIVNSYPPGEKVTIQYRKNYYDSTVAEASVTLGKL